MTSHYLHIFRTCISLVIPSLPLELQFAREPKQGRETWAASSGGICPLRACHGHTGSTRKIRRGCHGRHGRRGEEWASCCPGRRQARAGYEFVAAGSVQSFGPARNKQPGRQAGSGEDIKGSDADGSNQIHTDESKGYSGTQRCK